MRRLAWVLLVIAVSVLGMAVAAQEGSVPVNIAFIFDASGSMMAGMEGRTRLAVAQDAVAGLGAGLPAGTNASLWVYGHRLPQSDPAASCEDIEQVIELGPIDPVQFETTVRGIHAIGYTPISTSLQLAAQTLVERADERNSIVLISDGEETCGGSPCLMAQALKAANIELTVNTIGFSADDVTRQQLECIAEVTGGIYYDAPDAAQLNVALQAAVAPPGTIQLVDASGAIQWETEFTLQRADGNGTVLSALGSAVVAPGDYRVSVSSEPPVDVTVSVSSDETVPVVITLPEVSGVQAVNLAGDPLPELSFSLVSAATGETLYGTGMLAVPPGDYQVTMNTAFAQTFAITVPEDVTVDVPVDDAEGLIRLVDLSGDPLPEMYFNVLDPVSGEAVYGQGEMRVPPGVYPVAVRTAFETQAEADVADGQTVDVAVDPAFGTLVLTNLAGEVLADVSFNITDPATGEVHYAQGQIDLPPGSYTLNVPLPVPVNVEVTIADGQRLEVPINNDVGAIRVVDSAGNVIPGLTYAVTDLSTGEVSYGSGEYSLAPGDYTVSVNLTFPFETTVSVRPNEVTDIPVDTQLGTIQIVDEDGAPLPTQLFSITNTASGDTTSVTGTVDVPPGTYTVRVYTIFPFEVEVDAAAGEVTPVEVDTRLGTIQIVDEDGAPLPTQLFSITNTASGDSTSTTGQVDVPPGTYTVRVYTVFPFEVEVDAAAGEVTPVEVDTRLATIQIVDEDGAPLPRQLFSITNTASGDSTSTTGQVDVPPGTYTVTVYTVFPFDVEVDAAAGEVTPVEVDTRAGTVRMVNGTGRIQRSLLFSIERLDSGDRTSTSGEIDVPPGLYHLTVYADKTFELDVEVVDGEVTAVNIQNQSTDHPAP